MAAVGTHYDEHLGRIYGWMIGDVDAAIARNRAELEALGLHPGPTGVAVDLGSGPGLHAIPLAQIGYSVVALDTCAVLNDELRARAGTLPVRVVADDVLAFRRHCGGAVDAILCMGDTLTHLASPADVETLLGEVAAALAAGGIFVATFRDYVARELTGNARFIPVRADASRILTCFLEYGPKTVTVHDLVHERDADGGWRQRVGSYEKLRLDPAAVAASLEHRGLAVVRDTGAAGMARIVARRG
jgi:SAM-dependent methyltransferase